MKYCDWRECRNPALAGSFYAKGYGQSPQMCEWDWCSEACRDKIAADLEAHGVEVLRQEALF